jgi:short-subunit dehydrogenase
MDATANGRAIVTGASEGIGRALALALARAGFPVTVVARNRERLESLLGELGGEGHRLLAADLATEAGVAAVVAAMAEDHCALLVNNAAFGAVGDFAEVPLATQVNMLRLNVEAPVVLAHAFLRQAVRGDALVNLSSVVAFLPQPAQPLYTATKAFVTSLSETLWQNAKSRGVKVFAVHPGATDTEFAARAGRDPDRRRPRLIRQLPEEVAADILRALEGPWGPDLVTGWPNRIFCSIARLLPRKLLLALLSRLAR